MSPNDAVLRRRKPYGATAGSPNCHLILTNCRFSVVTGVSPVRAQSAADTAATTAHAPFHPLIIISSGERRQSGAL
jgi:hypothetical protein